MATTKPRFSITVTDEMLSIINDYQHKNKMATQTKAVVALIEKGIEVIESNYNRATSDNFGISFLDKKMLEIFHKLDVHGKEMVEMVLNKEYERCAATADPSDKRADEILEKIDNRTRKKAL